MNSKKTAPTPKKTVSQSKTTKTAKTTKPKAVVYKPATKDSGNSFIEHLRKLLFILIMAAVIGAIIYFVKPQKKIIHNEDYNIGMAAGIIYRHTVAYKQFCKQYDFELTQYPENFVKFMKKDIDKIENAAQANGYSLEQLYERIESQGDEVVSQSVAEDMENFRKNAIIWLAANHYNVSTDKIKWSEDMRELMNMHDACALFDDFSAQYDFSKTNGYKVIKQTVKKLK